MRTLTMQMSVCGMSADEIYDTLGRFDSYPAHTDAVRSVEVEESDGERSTSSWEIEFRSGILRWREEDRLFPGERRIAFRALGGDLERFVGEWRVEESPHQAVVTFAAEFDLGLGMLNELVEPVAEEALFESIERIVGGLTGGRSRVIEGPASRAA